MNIILVDEKKGRSSTFKCQPFVLMLFLLLLLGFTLFVGYAISEALSSRSENPLHVLSKQSLSYELNRQNARLSQLRGVTEQRLDAFTLQVSELQARIVRLDALGQRISEVAKLPADEFHFSRKPALGGPEDRDLGMAYQMPSFMKQLDELSLEIQKREEKLEILEALLEGRRLHGDVFVAGRPIKRGWLSSRYGRRTDPFTGRLAWHKGVDFAGEENSEVLAVASGVVVWSGTKSGYGNLVEINHGGGFVTRYAHNKKHLVKVGDIVRKGDPISLMGSTGRSTGPHVHFEVVKNGKQVNPEQYIHRTDLVRKE